MHGCDDILLAKMFKNISYEEIILNNFFSNDIRETSFANESIFFPVGRGYLDFTTSLHNLGIKFKEVTLKDILKLEDFSNVMLLTPKEMISNIKKISYDSVQFACVYSSFNILKITNKKIHLLFTDTNKDNEIILEIDDMIKLECLKVKPLGFACKFIVFDNLDMVISENTIEKNIINHIKNNLGDSVYDIEGTISTKGLSFYDKFISVLTNLKEHGNKSKADKIKVFIFIALISSGGSCLYRKEALTSLGKTSFIKFDKSNEYDQKVKSLLSMWRKLIKFIRNNLPEESEISLSDFNTNITEQINSLKNQEIEIMKLILEGIER